MGEGRARPTAKLGGAGDRFGDYLCLDCPNLLCVSGHDQFTNTKFTRPISQISKSNDDATADEPPTVERLPFVVLKGGGGSISQVKPSSSSPKEGGTETTASASTQLLSRIRSTD